MRHLFNSKVNIVEVVEADDGLLGKTESPVVVHRDLPCRINWSRGTEKIFFDKETYFRDAKVYCGVVDITVKHRLVFRDRTYRIVSVRNPDNMNRYLILDIKLIE